MKRYTTAQAISILSKPGREWWYAEADSGFSMFDERIKVYQARLETCCKRHDYSLDSWKATNGTSLRPDWRIIKPKREKLRSIGFAQLPADVVAVMRDLTSDGSDYEIFARRVGK